MFSFRDKEIAGRLIERLKRNRKKLKFMHVCGTHHDTIYKFGLNKIFEECNIEVVEGPGCPVCVTTPKEIEEAVALSLNGKIVATYGDMTKVPGMNDSLSTAKAKGGDIRPVYSIEDAIEMARRRRDKDVIFMAVGFETTAPSTAVALLSDIPDNFYILSCHRLIPPAVKAILEMGEIRLDGFIEPGHVSTIIGVEPYIEISKRYKIPQVIVGFEPLDVLAAVLMLIEQIENGESRVENEYARSVKFEGNIRAKKIMQEIFDVVDIKWRGFPVIEKSGLELKKKFEDRNARKVFEDILSGIEEGEEPKGCRCSEILRGVAKPRDCRLFGKICTPSHPVGPCMVSKEGSCYIEFRYSR